MTKKIWEVSFDIKLGAFLKKKIPGFSFKKIKKALERGIVKVNKKIETFASRKLKKGDVVELFFDIEKISQEKKIHKKRFIFKILLEDDFFIFINKPKGFVCDKKYLEKYFLNTFFVHRLDKDTTGVLILAKNRKALDKMIDLFSKKKIFKTYIALVDGILKKKGKVECFLRKKREGNIYVTPAKKGEYSLTKFEVIKNFKDFSYIKCFPITGRTHQIRVHMKMIGHPILGDYRYEKNFKYKKYVKRCMLHSYKISFIHPYTKKKIEVKAEVPEDFKEIIL